MPIVRLRRPPILRLHEICKRLRFLVFVVPIAVSVTMSVRVVGRADVFHAVDAAAFDTAVYGALAGHLS